MRPTSSELELYSISPTTVSSETTGTPNTSPSPVENETHTVKWLDWIARTTTSPGTIETANASPSPVKNEIHAKQWLAWITTLVSYQQEKHIPVAKRKLSDLWLQWATLIVSNFESTKKPNSDPEAMLGIFSNRMHQLHQEGEKLPPSMTIDSLTSHLKNNIERRLEKKYLPETKRQFLGHIQHLIVNSLLTTKNLNRIRDYYREKRKIAHPIGNTAGCSQYNVIIEEISVETAFYPGKETKKIYDKAFALAKLNQLVKEQQLNERSVSIG